MSEEPNVEWMKYCDCPECVKELREENQQLREMLTNPWRYPSRGELPTEYDREYLVTSTGGRRSVQSGAYIRRYELDIRAWTELNAPAPELEREENLLPNDGQT